MKDPDAGVRAHAIDALEALYIPRYPYNDNVSSWLIYALTDRNEEVRWNAARILGLYGDRRAVEPLLKTFAKEPDMIAAISSLGELRDHRAVGPLTTRLLKEHDGTICNIIIEALGVIRDERAVDAIITRLKADAPDDLRVGDALQALVEIGGHRAVAFVLASLQDGTVSDPEEAEHILLRLIGCCGKEDPQLYPGIITLLQSGKEDWSQYVAAIGLRQLNDSRAVGPFITALEKEERKQQSDANVYPGTSESIADALCAITGQHFGTNARTWRQWQHQQ